jgi:hypothetical protein
MRKYLVSLVRDYGVIISANSEEEAKRCTELFIGGEKDLSTEKNREEHHFNIEEIEMTTNDAIDVELYEE